MKHLALLVLAASAGYSQKPVFDDLRQTVQDATKLTLDLKSKNMYRSGEQALDRRDYEKAIAAFDRVIETKQPRADGAMYWKAFALGKLDRRDQALAVLGDLEKQYPQSRWLRDSQALAVEIRSAAGQRVPPESQTDEELKLLALGSLINQDPDRALPLLEKMLGDARNPPRVSSRALFLLAQSKSPKAQEIVGRYAKGASNPDLQMKAIEYLGVFRSNESLQTLVDVYASGDTTVKKAVASGLFRAGAAKQLVELARKESDPAMKVELVRQLSMMHSKEATDYMIELLSK
jgi:tetratricopeptide (TPR) repeat protein